MNEVQRKLKPEELLQAKDRVSEHWRLLPSEHQATMLLVLFREVIDSDMVEWAVNALLTLYWQDEEIGKHR